MDKTFPQTYISYYNHTYLPSIPLTTDHFSILVHFNIGFGQSLFWALLIQSRVFASMTFAA